MATYTVNISGATHNSYGYVTINGSKTTATGTTTYTSKPTISVYVGASSTVSRRYSTVTLNGEVVREGYGSYNLDFGDADTININISTATYNSNIYRNADITTETSSGGGGSGGGGSGGGGHSANVSGTAYEIEGGTMLIGGVGREIESGLTLVNGVQKDINFLSGEPVGNLAIGSSVYTPVGGVLKEFIVVQQDKPSSLYDDSCNGTWLMIKDLHDDLCVWNKYNTTTFSGSNILTFLNNTVLPQFDSAVQTLIKTVKIPYVSGSKTQYGVTKPVVSSGSNGLDVQLFPLSGYEVGWTTSTDSALPVDGACLSYFSGANNSKRIAYLSGKATNWWLRSLTMDGSMGVPVSVTATGSYTFVASGTTKYGARPTFILPANATVDENFQLIA